MAIPPDYDTTDEDFDHWGDAEAEPLKSCEETEEGYVDNNGDCDDTTAATNPDVPKDACDGEDNDCDGDIDEDYKDGWRLASFGSGVIYEIDPATAKVSTLASHELFRASTADVREDGRSILQDGGMLREFDVCRVTAVDLGETGVGRVGGISFSGGGVLVGLAQDTESLVTFDLATGKGKHVGYLGMSIGNDGLAWDCANDILYGVDADRDVVFQVDPVSGRTSHVVSTTIPFSVVGLEFDARTGHLWAASGPDLYDLAPDTGKSKRIGAFGVSVNDLVYVPPCP